MPSGNSVSQESFLVSAQVPWHSYSHLTPLVYVVYWSEWVKGQSKNKVLTLITAKEALLKKRLFVACWLELKVGVARHGADS